MAADFDVTLGISVDNALSEIKNFTSRSASEFKKITEQTLKLDTKEAERSLKNVGLSAQEMLTSFKGVNLPTNEIKKYASEFDNVQKSASAAMREQKSALAQLVATGQKGSVEFDKIQKELVENAKAANKFERALKEVDDEIDKLSGKKIDIDTDVEKPKSKLGGMGTMVAGAALAGGATAAVAGMAAVIDIGSQFEASLADFSAITGVGGKALDGFGQSARNLAKEFGGSAKEQVESFKGILSRLGPDIAKSPEALNEMSRSVNILAKASGLDATTAMDALTTSALQFGIDMSNPIEAAKAMKEQMNILAAGAKEGASEIPDVAEAIKVAGVAASGAKISFAETNAAIQTLAAGGKVGAEAGTALRNVIGLLQKQSGQGQKALAGLGTSTLELGTMIREKGLSEALGFLNSKLANVKNETERAQITMQLFGTENSAAAGIMLKNADAMGTLEKKLMGTNTATDQAKKNMGTFAASIGQLKATFEDLAIDLFQSLAPILKPLLDVISNTILPALKPILDVVGNVIGDLLVSLAPIFGEVMILIGGIFKELQPLIDVLLDIIKVALKPIGEIIKALSPVITELVGVLVSVLVPILKELEPVIGDIVQIFAEIVKIFAKLIIVAFQVGKAIYDAVAKFLGFNNAGEMMTVVIRYAIKAIGFFVEAIKGIYVSISAAVDGIIKFGKTVLEFFGIIDKKTEDSRKKREDSAKNDKSLPTIKSAFELFKKDIEGLQIKAPELNVKDFNAQKNKLVAGLDNAAERGLITQQQFMQLSTTLGGILKGGGGGGEGDDPTPRIETLAEAMDKLKQKLIGAYLAGGLYDGKNKDILETLANFSQTQVDLKFATSTVEKEIENLRISKIIQKNLRATKLGIDIVPESILLDKNEIPQIPAELKILTPNEVIEQTELLKFGTRLTSAFANLKFEFPETVDESKLDEESEIIKQQLKDREISYAEYVEKLDEIDAQRNKSINKNSEIFKQSVVQIAGFLKTEFENQAIALKESIDKQAEMLTTQEEKFNVYASSVGEVLSRLAAAEAVGFGAALAAGESFQDAFLKSTIDFLQKAIALYSFQILAAFATAIPPPLGFALGLTAIATLSGLLAVAKSKIGAEDGVVGISNGYNKTAGATDTIPIWVAQGESIINKAASQKHGNLLNVINNNGDVDRYIQEKYNTENFETLRTLNKLENAIRQINSSRVEVNDRRELIITDKRTIVKKSLNYR